jgi:hypothetical protein
MPSVRKLTDAGNSPTVVQTGTSAYQGRAVYEVIFTAAEVTAGTASEEGAIGASGVPAIGAAWSGTAPFTRLKVRSKSAKFVGATRYEVDVSYETGTLADSGTIVVPVPNLAYTIIRTEKRQVNVLYGITGSTHALAVPIDNGRGTPRDVSVFTFEVTVFKDPSTLDSTDIAAYLSLYETTNAASMTLPPVLGTAVGETFVITANKLLYKAVTVEPYDDLTRITHTLHAAGDHKVRWFQENQQGQATGSAEESVIYPSATWPTGLFT